MSPFTIGIILLVLSCVVWLLVRFRPPWWLLVTAIAVVMVGLGLISVWPTHIIAVNIQRIEAKPGHLYLTRDALVLDISRRWGRALMRVTPREGFDAASRVEMFWLESGSLRHVAIAEKGRVLATSYSGPKEWPLLIGVVEWHPQAIQVVARWVLPDGRNGGADGTYDADASSFDVPIEEWGQTCLGRIHKNYLERIRDALPAPSENALPLKP